MTSTGIRELKDNLSRYIRRIEAGERIAITAHGRVVAELVPASSKSVRASSRFDELVAVGYLDPQDRPGADVTCWAAVHGFSVLNVEGPLRGMAGADRDAALSDLLLRIDRGLGRRGEWAPLTR